MGHVVLSMGTLAITAIVMGLLTLVGLYFWVRQRQALGSTTNAFDKIESVADDNHSAVIVASEYGQILHINRTAQTWLDLNDGLPDLEYIARQIQPSDSFHTLFTQQGRASFQLGNRWVEASSYFIPAASGQRSVVVMRELADNTAASEGALDLSQAIQIVNQIGEMVNASMGVEQVLQVVLEITGKVIPYDAGEICLWKPETERLEQRGWLGDSSYLITIAEKGGGYDLGDGVAGWVANHRKPLLVDRYTDQVSTVSLLADNPYEQAAAIPLLLNERFVGTLGLFRSGHNAFSQTDQALLQAINKPIALAIYNTELYNQQEERIQDIASLQEIAEHPRSTEDTTPIYRLLNERIARLLQADMCGVFVYDNDREALTPELPFYGLPDHVVQGVTISLSPDTAAHDIWTKQPYWVSNDVEDEPLVEALGLRPLVDVAGISNTALIPMQIGNERIGMIAVSNKQTEGGFTPRDIQNLRVLVAQAAIVVENIRLYQRERRIDIELIGLQEMTHAIGTLSHEGEFYAEITERIARLMECQMSGILLYDSEKQRLSAQLPFYGIDDSLLVAYHIDLSPGTVMEELWTEDDYWISNRVVSDPLVYEAKLDALAEAVGVQKTLIAVMSAGGRRTGIVQISNKVDGSDFADTDARLLLIFATQAAAIIENARLYQEVQRRADQADSLRKVAEMAGAVLTTNQTFAPILEEISNFVDSPFVYINVLDSTTGNLITYPHWTFGGDLKEPAIQNTQDQGYKYSVVISGNSFFTNDVLNDKRVLPGYLHIARRFGIFSTILVPLVFGDRILGELGVANRKPERPYTEADVRELETIAAQIASAVERLLLYEATGENLRRRMEELDAISRVSNELTQTVELDPVLDIIRHEAVQATHADGSTVAILFDPQYWDAPDKPVLNRRIGDAKVLKVLTDIEREAVLRGAEPIIISNYETSELTAAPGTAQSAAAAAILYLDQIVGVIHVHHADANHFDERASAFLMTLSTKASLAFQNSIRYQEQMDRSDRLRSRVDQLNRIFELGQMIQGNSDPVMVLEAVAYSIQQSVGYDTVLMTLFDENEQVVRRVAQAGMPLDEFEESKSLTMPLDTLDALLKDEYRTSETYFFPLSKVADWYVEGTEVLSAAFTHNRTLHGTSSTAWHDGDMLLVSIVGTAGGKRLGLISLDRPHNSKRPDRSTIEVLEIFAHQASAMIENTRLFITSQQNAEQEARLNEVMKAIADTLDVVEIVKAVATGVQQLVPFSHLNMALVDADQQGFDLIKAIVQPDESIVVTPERRSSLEHTALGYAFESQSAQLYHANNEEIQTFEDLRDWYAKGEQRSLILPLITGGESLGVLHIGSEHADSRLESLQPLFIRMVQLISGTLQSARLFNQAVNLQILNQSVVESIQQGIVVLDNSGRVINVNEFMRERYGWDDKARQKDLFTYRPEIARILKKDLQKVLKGAEHTEAIGQTTTDADGTLLVRNFYMYPLRYGKDVRGAVLLVEDVTDRTQLEQTIESRANQLAALTEVSTRISAALEREEVVNMATDEMGWILPYDTITMWRRVGLAMVLEGANGFDEDFTARHIQVVISDHPRIQELVETQRVVTHNDTDSPIYQGLPGETKAQSWMGIPLVNQGHIVGLLILTKETPNAFETRAEQHVAMAFASQVAIALANAELFGQTFERTNELGTLLEAAQATSLTRTLDDVFRTVAELMFSALDMDDCAIMIWDEVDNQLEVQMDINRDGSTDQVAPKETRYKLSEYNAKHTALTNRRVIAVTELDAELYPKEVDELRENEYDARLLVPLVVRDQSIGLIQLQQRSITAGELNDQKMRLAQGLGSQVAIAIENARLSTETTSRFEELLTINALSQAISSTLQLSDMLEIIREQVPAVTHASEMYLALYEKESDRITFPLAVADGKDTVIKPRKLNDDEVSYIINNRRPLSLGADYFSVDDLRQSMSIRNGEGDAKSYMGVPLIVGDEVLGVLAIRDQERTRAFNLNDERILTTVGSQLGAAIQNARLFEQVRNYAGEMNSLVGERTDELEQEKNRLDTLYQITSELMQTLDMDQLLQRALTMVSKAVGANDGAILLSDPATDQLYCRAAIEADSLFEDEYGQPSHPANMIANWLIQNYDMQHNIIISKDLRKETYWDVDSPHAKRWRSGLAVMLETNEDPMGVMVFLNKKKAAFTDKEVQLLVAAANQVSAAINSADLYQLIRDQAERLGKLLRTEQEEAQKYTAILEGIADGVILSDAEGTIILFNSAAERVLQLPRDQVQGQSISRLTGIYGDADARWSQLISRWSDTSASASEHKSDFVAEQIVLQDRIISAHLSPVFIGTEFLGTVSLFRDITKSVEVDRVKTEFITNVSHEFRTPLTPIKGYTDLLLMGAAGKLSGSQEDMLGTIKDNVDRLNILVNEVLDISQLDSPDSHLSLKHIDLNLLIPDVVNRFASRTINLDKNIQSSVQVDDNVPQIRADEDKFLKIMSNLIENAFNYTRPNGSIITRVRTQPGGRSVLISIADTGVGIPEHFHESVWRRFERYDEHALELDVAGTGLGLSLVKELVTLHNGEVWFESEEGKGTTFFIELPIEQPEFVTDTMEVPRTNPETVGD